MQKIIILFLIFVASVSLAEDNKMDLIDEVVVLSGISRQLGVIPDDISDLFSEIAFMQKSDGLLVSSENINAYSRMLKKICKKDLILQDLRFFLRDNLSSQELLSVIEWLNNPLVRRLSELEVESAINDSELERKIYFETIQDQQPSEYRVQMCLFIDHKYSATTSNISLYNNILATFYEALDYQLPVKERLTKEKINENAQSKTDEMKEIIANNTIFNILFMYRSVSNIDLLRYLKTCESEDIDSYFKVIAKAYNYSIDNCLNRFLDRLSFSRVHH